MVAGTPPQQPLQRDQRQREREQHRGQLQRRRLVERAVPDAVDRVGQRPVAEQVDGAEISQRLHHRERDAGGQSGPGERQRDPPQRGRMREPERPRGLQRLPRLAQERTPAEHVDVWVEHEREHHDRAERGAHVGQRRAHGAQGPLKRARLVVLAEQHEHEHVGRDRQRQDQRPVEPAAAGKVEEADEHRQPAAEHQRPDRHSGRQHQAGRERVRAAGRRRSGRTPRPGRRTTPAAPAAAPRAARRRPVSRSSSRMAGGALLPPDALHQRDRGLQRRRRPARRRSGPSSRRPIRGCAARARRRRWRRTRCWRRSPPAPRARSGTPSAGSRSRGARSP